MNYKPKTPWKGNGIELGERNRNHFQPKTHNQNQCSVACAMDFQFHRRRQAANVAKAAKTATAAIASTMKATQQHKLQQHYTDISQSRSRFDCEVEQSQGNRRWAEQFLGQFLLLLLQLLLRLLLLLLLLQQASAAFSLASHFALLQPICSAQRESARRGADCSRKNQNC